ncbi:MAG: arylsulfatase [Bacteroidetes bacterium]|nr:arylsulfatase [Bacteroidota bacterium]
MRRTALFFRTSIIVMLLALALASCQHPDPVTKPNVILIITDDQGYGEIGFHGNEWISTPNIDRLAEESYRLTDFHVGTTCAPTRSGLMTGRNCNRVGVWHTVMGRSLLRKGEVTMADVFRNNGYSTGMFGKWHLGDNYPYRPHDRGFDEAFYHGGGGVTQAPDYWDNDYFDDTYFRNGEPEKVKGYCTDVWFENAIDFMDRNREKPFFCYLSTNAPHGPFHVPQKYIDLYKDNPDITNPNFYGMITNVDENLGVLREKLKELGLADNTILIFMTDNGTAAGVELDKDGFLTRGYNAGMRGRKGSEYNGGHRVPFFIHWKDGDMQTGKDMEQISSYTDILPTLVDLCGLEGPEVEYDGKSIVPLLTEEFPDWTERIIITDTQREDTPVKGKQSAVMTNRWHLIRGEELYDMDADPGQSTDVAGEHPGVVEKLQDAYEIWWKETSVDFDDYCEIIINTEEENPTCIRSHDWHSAIIPPWNQGHIRSGIPGNGFWVVDVATAGTYEFALRRWPLETGLPLNGSLPPSEPVPGGKAQPAGVSIHFTGARIKVGEQEQSSQVDPDQQDVRFSFDLVPGEFRMQTWLEDMDGGSRGAYFVYVTRLK